MLELNDFQPYNYNNLVRRGSRNDGGYLLPNDVSAHFLISLGLGDNWKFELDLIKYKQIKKFLVFDHSVTLLSLVKKLINRRRSLKAFIYSSVILIRYLRDFVFLRNLHVSKKITKQGGTANSNEISLVEIFQNFIVDPHCTIVMKIDIEGSEYEIIEQILELSSQTLVLIIEFHDILKMKEKFAYSLELLKSRFLLIHTHPNNYGSINEFSIPDVCEFTFINKTLCIEDKKVNKLPRTGLDSPCNPGRPDYELIFD